MTLTRAELHDLVRAAVLDALTEFDAAQRPAQATLSGADLAARLGLSRTAVHRLRHDGMPAIRIGEVYRYELGACLAWLRERGRDAG